VVLDSDLQKLVARAAAGERTAIAELEGRSAAERSSTEWKALGRGYFQIQNFKASIACYGSAVRKAPNLADDADLVADVRKMVYRSDTGADALNLIASAFGSTGADLLFDVWRSGRKGSPQSQLSDQAKELLSSDEVRGKASAALLVALDVSTAKSCDDYLKLMPRAAQNADERSLPALRKLSARRGCGFLGFSDCFPCLRRTRDLAEAVETAKQHSAPSLNSAPASSVETQ
jgi:hypothetical protein